MIPLTADPKRRLPTINRAQTTAMAMIAAAAAKLAIVVKCKIIMSASGCGQDQKLSAPKTGVTLAM